MQAKLTETLAFKEDLVADGFESFTKSQYHPCNINILVGKESQFLYESTYTDLRRKGRMTPEQRKKRALLEAQYKPKPKALERSCRRLFEQIDEHWCRSSKPALTLSTHNPLFSVNYYDRELRKDMATFRRESTCFARNVAALLLRFANHQVWHNYAKPHRIVSTAIKPPVHAVMAGVEESMIAGSFEALFTQRSFFTHGWLSDEAITNWRKGHRTPLKKRPEYLPNFASLGLVHSS